MKHMRPECGGRGLRSCTEGTAEGLLQGTQAASQTALQGAKEGVTSFLQQ